MVIALLGLVGTPPTIVFASKLTMTAAAWEAGPAWVVVVVFVNTVAAVTALLSVMLGIGAGLLWQTIT